jgi:hypothetical protein
VTVGATSKTASKHIAAQPQADSVRDGMTSATMGRGAVRPTLYGTRYAMMAAPLTCPRRTPSRDAVSALQASMGSVSTLLSCTTAT